MKYHDLKTWPDFFQAIKSGKKNFEIRKNDRDYKVNDWLYLREYDPVTSTLTGEYEVREILYILQGGCWGVEFGYCILGL